MTERQANRLAGTSSPYLLQHAHNPVDWFPWGEEAFAKARNEDRPVFLSVGYAACHWCHVMERESFEDETTAKLLNERFVAIKVDREERPDVDGIYMDAVQAMSGSGGWPMSVFLTPEGKPFYAGTYFPDEPRHGLPSFRQVLEGIADAWTTRRDEVEVQSGRVTESIGRVGELEASDEPLTGAVANEAFQTLRHSFDPRWGGFGGAPKFPQPMTLEFVLRQAIREVPDALEMTVLTLDRMAGGGMFDQIGGGFARYSTDGAWMVPHFEKMLYDNAQLAALYARAWLVTRNDRYREISSRTLGYLLREMRHPEGGFFSSQDADTEGVEGKFAVWSWDELVTLVGEEAAEAFGATTTGNWDGTNVLRAPVGNGNWDDARSRLFEAREARVRPAVDDKVLTAWNALAIRAFAEAGRIFDERTYVEAAVSCADFVWDYLRNEDGRLLRSWRDGTAGVKGFADDHALLAGAFLTLYETTADVRWFVAARELCDTLLDLFADQERGGFFQTGADADELVVRPKDLYDNAVPSGNSAAAEVLLRLALFTGEARYEDAAVSALRLVRDVMTSAPGGFGQALCALDLYLGPSYEVAIVGDPDAPDTRALVDEVVRARWRPNLVLAVASPKDIDAAQTVALLSDRPPIDEDATAYVCQRFVCRLPVTEPSALADSIDARP
ncbi:MAG: thioredoxin domain-containing protein [Actinomycetota bacterium]|nr:thioredoxin domain-containing protein [Actinomycetota bacterium]